MAMVVPLPSAPSNMNTPAKPQIAGTDHMPAMDTHAMINIGGTARIKATP